MDYTGDFSGLDAAVELAETARDQSYVPFTGLHEGTLAILENGHAVVGSRVENSNYTNTRHAAETVLGDLLEQDADPTYLVVSTESVGRESFLKATPQLLYEFVDGEFPIIVHTDDLLEQYTVDALAKQSGKTHLTGGSAPENPGAFTVKEPYERVQTTNAVAQLQDWRDAAYDELQERLQQGILFEHDDPLDDVMREAKDALFTADEKPEAVLNELWGHAQKAQKHAYEPYSEYPVGVSMLTTDGRIFTGQNMEDADISNTMHGEGNAITTAVTWGIERGDIALLNVHSESPVPPYPCGLCRQTAAEFADENTILGTLGMDGSDIEEYSTLGRHLPDMFRL